MIISNKIWISNILRGSWKILFLVLIVSIGAYLMSIFLLKEIVEMPGMIPSILGTALAFFIGFNNNQAYDRWWEARKIWGALVNDSRTWSRQIISYTSASEGVDHKELEIFRTKVVRRHIAFLYALKENLRESNTKEYKKYLSEEEYNLVETKTNKHNAILNNQSIDLEILHDQGVIDGVRFLEINKSLIAFSDEMGMSERIKNTVFPTIYHRYTRFFIWFLIFCVTIVSADMIGPWSILMGFIIGTVYIITHKIGLVLLNPFDELISGIPLNQITRTIEINLLETLGEKDIPEPEQSVNNKYIM